MSYLENLRETLNDNGAYRVAMASFVRSMRDVAKEEGHGCRDVLDAAMQELGNLTDGKRLTPEQARKAAFVRAINDALIEHGGGRYDYLGKEPLVYEVDGGEEFVRLRFSGVCVSADSLPAMMRDVADSLFLC